MDQLCTQKQAEYAKCIIQDFEMYTKLFWIILYCHGYTLMSTKWIFVHSLCISVDTTLLLSILFTFFLENKILISWWCKRFGGAVVCRRCIIDSGWVTLSNTEVSIQNFPFFSFLLLLKMTERHFSTYWRYQHKYLTKTN